MSNGGKMVWQQNAAGTSCQVPGDLRWDDAMQKAFLECASYHLNGMTATVSGRVITASGQPTRPLAVTPAGAIEVLVGSLARGMRDLEEAELESHVGARAVSEPDLWQALTDSGAVRSLGSGNFAYSGVFLDALNWFDSQTLQHALEMGAVEEAYPTTVPAADLAASGYLKSFPHHMIAASPAAVDADAVAHVQSGAVLDSLMTPAGSAALQPPARILSPTVCYHCFGSRRGSVVGGAGVGGSGIVTAIGSCHRHEPHGVQTLERLNTFTMREIIHFGSKSSVAAGLDTSYDWLLALLRRWDIPFRATTASDPFFGTSSDSKRAFQTALALKREVRLPVAGTDRWISVASFNHHGDHMQRTFDLSAPDAEEKLETGCVGFGYERMLFCLLAYIGLDREAWPAGK